MEWLTRMDMDTYGVDFWWIWIFFREKFWSGVDNGVKIPKCLQNTYCPYSFLTV